MVRIKSRYLVVQVTCNERALLSDRAIYGALQLTAQQMYGEQGLAITGAALQVTLNASHDVPIGHL
jgi:hypothetical protein